MKTIIMLLSVFAITSCTSPGKRTGIGAGAGAGAGALIGGIIGHQSGNAASGALIGAAAGALVGGAIGNRLDKQAKELEAIAETKRTEHGIVTKLKGDILFDTNSSKLKPAAVENINKIAAIIKKYPEDRIQIVGHTDSTGKADKNQSLSEQRALSVKNQLANAGLPQDILSHQGVGPNQPVSDNKTAGGRSKNRRVELQITVDESKVPQS